MKMLRSNELPEALQFQRYVDPLAEARARRRKAAFQRIALGGALLAMLIVAAHYWSLLA